MKEVSIQFFGFQEYNTVMHELEITQHILADSIREAERHGAKAIREIRLAIGPFSGFVPECIQMYMDVLAEGTIAQGRASRRGSSRFASFAKTAGKLRRSTGHISNVRTAMA